MRGGDLPTFESVVFLPKTPTEKNLTRCFELHTPFEFHALLESHASFEFHALIGLRVCLRRISLVSLYLAAHRFASFCFVLFILRSWLKLCALRTIKITAAGDLGLRWIELQMLLVREPPSCPQFITRRFKRQ